MDYIDRNEYHRVIKESKEKGELTPRALELFQIHAKEAARDFFFQSEMDKEDAIQTALHDLLKYWKNFKEYCVVTLKIQRNFLPADKIIIKIKNYGEIVITPGVDFEIKETINKSIDEILNFMSNRQDVVKSFVDKVNNNLTFMDVYNGKDMSVRSEVVVYSKPDISYYIKKKNGKFKYVKELPNDTVEYETRDVRLIKSDEDITTLKFAPPPNAFSYFTSFVRNAVIKSINKNNPKQFRNNNKISINQINSDGNGMYNI